MSTHVVPLSTNQASPQGKQLWEDPCISFERELEVRAQGHPPNGSSSWQQGFLGPLGNNQNCLS